MATSYNLQDKEDTISSKRRVLSVFGIIIFFGTLAVIACAFCCR